MDITFPSSYADSRARFIRDFELLRPQWAESHLETYPLKTDPSLSIDYVRAVPRKKENLVIITTAERKILLQQMLVYFRLHIEDFGDLRSYEVLETLFKS